MKVLSIGALMPLNVKDIIAGLKSPIWGVRTGAQEQLTKLDAASDWIKLIWSFDTSDENLLDIIHNELLSYIYRAGAKDLDELIPALMLDRCPLSHSEEYVQEIMESFLSSSVISQRNKTNALIKIFIMDRSFKRIPEEALIYIIRAINYVRAKRAITYIEKLLNHQSEQIVFEVIRALKGIDDPKSGRYLEPLLGHPNRNIASVAVEAYGEIDKSIWRYFRIYKLYYKADISVRPAIIRATMKLHPTISSWMLQKFFNYEKDEEIRFQIIKKIASVQISKTAWFLMKVISKDPSPRLRSIAQWVLDGMPSVTIVSAIKKGLNTDDDQIKKWALLKAGQLQPRKALKLLAPFYKGKKALEPMLFHTLIEVMAKIPKGGKVVRWTMSQITRDPVCAVTAVAALLRRPNPPVLEILDRVEHQGVQPLAFALGQIADRPVLLQQPEIIERVLGYVDHAASQVRFLASRLLIRKEEKDLLHIVWRRALKEGSIDQEFFAGLISQALSYGELKLSWLPILEPLDPKAVIFFENILLKIRATWTLDLWRDAIYLAAACEKRNFTEQEELILKFCLQDSQFRTGVLSHLLEQEDDPITLGVLVRLASDKDAFINIRTVNRVFNKLLLNQYSDPTPVFEFLTHYNEEKLLEPFTDWVRKQPEGDEKLKAYSALSIWLNKNQSERAVGGSNG
jgi:hypothetical protein